MSRITVTFFLCVFIILIYGCTGDDLLENNDGSVAFYSLKDPMKASDASKLQLDKLILNDTPIFSSKEINYYKWKEHTFSLKPEAAGRLRKFSDENMSVFGVPFVVMVGRERIYLGALWAAYSSLAPTVPFIMMDPPFIKDSTQSGNIFRIGKQWPETQTDVREDSRIYSALKMAGILIE